MNVYGGRSEWGSDLSIARSRGGAATSDPSCSFLLPVVVAVVVAIVLVAVAVVVVVVAVLALVPATVVTSEARKGTHSTT